MTQPFTNSKFCQKTSLIINNKQIINDIYDTLKANFSCKIEKLCGTEYIKENETYKLDESEQLCFTFDFINNHYFIYATTINYKKYCILMDPKNKKYLLVKIRFADDIYKNTLLFGNIIWTENGWIFYAADILMKSGQFFKKMAFHNRIKIIKKLLEDEYINDNILNTFSIISKPYYDITNLSKYLSCLHNIKLPLDSISIKRDNTTFGFMGVHINENTTPENNLMNTEQEQEMDIKITNLPDVFEVYKNNNFIGIAYIPTLRISQYVNNLFEDTNKDIIKIKCSYNNKFEKWTPQIPSSK